MEKKKTKVICLCGKEMKPAEECIEIDCGDMSSEMRVEDGYKCVGCGLWHNHAYIKFNHTTYAKWKYSSDHLEKVIKEYNDKKKETEKKLKEIEKKRKPKTELGKEPIRSNDMDTEKPEFTITILQGVEHLYLGDKAVTCPCKDKLCTSACLWFSTKEAETFKVVKCRDFVMGQVTK